MGIVGHGIDLVETARIARLLENHGDRFLRRCFTESEQAYAASNRSRRIEHLAGRFAAKEAVLKALGTGLAQGIAWTEVDVVRAPSGQPRVELHGAAATTAARQGVTQWWLTITHVRTHAMASAIAVAEAEAEAEALKGP